MQEENTVDLSVLWNAFKNNFFVIGIASIIFAVIFFIASSFVVSKEYEASTLLYVESSQNKSETINTNDIAAAQKIINTCIVIFSSENTVGQAKEIVGNINFDKGNVEIASKNSTEILEIKVTTNSAEESALIANAYAAASINEFERIIQSGSITVVEEARVPSEPSGPNVKLYTLIGFLLGLFVSYGIFFVFDIIDTRVKPGDDLYTKYDIPVFAEIIDYQAKFSGGDKYD